MQFTTHKYDSSNIIYLSTYKNILPRNCLFISQLSKLEQAKKLIEILVLTYVGCWTTKFTI